MTDERLFRRIALWLVVIAVGGYIVAALAQPVTVTLNLSEWTCTQNYIADHRIACGQWSKP